MATTAVALVLALARGGHGQGHAPLAAVTTMAMATLAVVTLAVAAMTMAAMAVATEWSWP